MALYAMKAWSCLKLQPLCSLVLMFANRGPAANALEFFQDKRGLRVFRQSNKFVRSLLWLTHRRKRDSLPASFLRRRVADVVPVC